MSYGGWEWGLVDWQGKRKATCLSRAGWTRKDVLEALFRMVFWRRKIVIDVCMMEGGHGTHAGTLSGCFRCQVARCFVYLIVAT